MNIHTRLTSRFHGLVAHAIITIGFLPIAPPAIKAFTRQFETRRSRALIGIAGRCRRSGLGAWEHFVSHIQFLSAHLLSRVRAHRSQATIVLNSPHAFPPFHPIHPSYYRRNRGISRLSNPIPSFPRASSYPEDRRMCLVKWLTPHWLPASAFSFRHSTTISLFILLFPTFPSIVLFRVFSPSPRNPSRILAYVFFPPLRAFRIASSVLSAFPPSVPIHTIFF